MPREIGLGPLRRRSLRPLRFPWPPRATCLLRAASLSLAVVAPILSVGPVAGTGRDPRLSRLSRLSAPAAASVDPVDRCQRAIEVGGMRFAKQVLRSISQCAAAGRSEPITDCLESNSLRNTLAKLRASWRMRAVRDCATVNVASQLGYLGTCDVGASACAFPSPVLDAPGEGNDLIDCLACRLDSDVRGGGIPAFRDFPAVNRCHGTVGKQGILLIRVMLKAFESCQRKAQTASLAACLSDPLIALRIDKQLAAWRTSAEKDCADANPITSSPGYQTECSGALPGFPGSCPPVAPPCTFNPTTKLSGPGGEDDLLDCLACRTQEAALAVGRDLVGANLCCVSSDCATVQTRRACRRATGSPAQYRIDSVDAGDIAYPHGIDMGTDGTLYIADSRNDRVKKVSPSGQASVLASTPPFPTGISVDNASGDVFVSLRCSHQILRVTPTGTTTVFAGTGVPGHSGDEGLATAAQIIGPNRARPDGAGNVFITESGLLRAICDGVVDVPEKMRMVDASGIIHSVAGIGGLSGAGEGGPALAAGLGIPYSLSFASDGSLIIGEVGLNRVLRVDAAGNLNRVAGRPVVIYGAYFGDGGLATQARFYQNCGVPSGPNGVTFIADMMTNRVRLVDRLGSIISIAGTGLAYSSNLGDGGPGQLADAGCPEDAVVGPDGRVYFSSLTANRIRVLTLEPF